MLRARTLASIVRTVVSTSLALLLFKARLGKGLEAALWGGVLADYATWLIRSLMLLPRDRYHGRYDAALNVLVGWMIFRFSFADATLDAEALGVAFGAFALVGVLKLGWYGVKFFGTDEG